MIQFTIRNPHETVPLTEETARMLGFRAARDSSGRLAAIYELRDEEEAEAARAQGLVVERVVPLKTPCGVYKHPLPAFAEIPEDARCGRAACRARLIRAGARRSSVWFNHGNRGLYCVSCARKINDYNAGLCEEVPRGA